MKILPNFQTDNARWKIGPSTNIHTVSSNAFHIFLLQNIHHCMFYGHTHTQTHTHTNTIVILQETRFTYTQSIHRANIHKKNVFPIVSCVCVSTSLTVYVREIKVNMLLILCRFDYFNCNVSCLMSRNDQLHVFKSPHWKFLLRCGFFSRFILTTIFTFCLTHTQIIRITFSASNNLDTFVISELL